MPYNSAGYHAAYSLFVHRPAHVLVVGQSTAHATSRTRQLAGAWPRASIWSVVGDCEDASCWKLEGDAAATTAPTSGTMDVIVDIRSRGSTEAAERVLRWVWPWLRAGGRVCIEDVPVYSNTTGASWERAATGTAELAMPVHKRGGRPLPSTIATIFSQHDAFLVRSQRSNPRPRQQGGDSTGL